MRKIVVLFLCALSLSMSGAGKLIPDMKFRRLDTQDGMSSSQVNCVLKDSRGFVWIGTPYGLNRYDGFRFKTYYSNMRDTTSMRDNYTDQIFEAYDGKLWLKQGMNYCVYDPVTEKFERNAGRVLAKMGITGSVERLFIDSKKNFWVKVYEQGVFYYNPSTKKLHQFRQGYERNQFNPAYGVASMAEMGNKVVMVTNCGELVCLDGEKGTIPWENKWMRQNGAPENQDYKLTIDKDGNYWVVTQNKVYVYIKHINRWFSSLDEYLDFQNIDDVPRGLDVWGLLIDDNGWLWLICDHEGLIIIDLKGNQWKQFKNSKYDETTLSDNTPRHLYHDPDGRMWIGTYKNGVNQYVEGLSSLRNVELGDINTVCEDKYGNYWVGTNDQGILVFDPRTEEVIAHYTKDNSGLSNNIMVGSWPASDGTIWFGSYNGGLSHAILSAGNPAQATIVNYRSTGLSEGLANNSVWALTEDKWNRIWFTTLGGGLQVLDPKTGKFRTWDTKNTSLPSDYMTSIGWTKKGWVIMGTSYYYALVNPVSMKLVTQTLPEDPAITVNISSTAYIIEDSRGLIWQGSTSGLTVYDPKTKFMTLLDMTKGLYGSSINSIVEDKKHFVWAVTDHGVSRISPQKQENGTWQFNVRSFNSRDGLQKTTYNQRSTWLTRDGILLVGGQGGLDIIDPSKLQETKSKEKPVFSGLLVFDEDVAVGEKIHGRVILDEALDVCRSLDLGFDEQFTIQLATNEVTVNNHQRFAYLLEGFNANWVKTSEQNPNITYNSLRAGSYLLHVRLLNDDGTIGDEESTLRITIHPPLWRTRWMIVLYMILIAVVAWLWRKRFLKKQKEQMELERLRRDIEKKQWMSEMRKQMAKEMPAADDAPRAKEEQPVVTASGDAGETIVIMEEETPEPTLELNLERDNLVPFLKEVCDAQKVPDGKRLKMSFFPLSPEVEAKFDRAQLAQAVTILFENSMRFSPSDCRIKVFVEKNQGKALVRISDNGIGIPEEAREYVFTKMDDEDSNNLKLHLVKDIVTAHGGTVIADGNPGGGTLFVISLPLDEVEIEEAVIIEEE